MYKHSFVYIAQCPTDETKALSLTNLPKKCPTDRFVKSARSMINADTIVFRSTTLVKKKIYIIVYSYQYILL